VQIVYEMSGYIKKVQDYVLQSEIFIKLMFVMVRRFAMLGVLVTSYSHIPDNKCQINLKDLESKFIVN
jgi:hypothetical protein